MAEFFTARGAEIGKEEKVKNIKIPPLEGRDAGRGQRAKALSLRLTSLCLSPLGERTC